LVDAYVNVVTKLPTPLHGTYCNALLLAHWSVSSVQLCRSVRAFADSMAYTFGEQSGALYYSFPAARRPYTDSDRLAFGFSSTQRQATIISVSSHGLDDSIRVDLASIDPP